VPEETEKDILKKILTVLEDQKNLFLVLNQERLAEVKKNLLKPGTIESQVYDLCDGVNTTQLIAGKIQKSTDYTGAVLSSLRRKGLVKSFDKGGDKVHDQSF